MTAQHYPSSRAPNSGVAAAELAHSEWLFSVISELRPDAGSILDFGGASGADLRAFQEHDWDVSLCDLAAQNTPSRCAVYRTLSEISRTFCGGYLLSYV